MNSPDFEIYNGALLAYRGTASAITLPDEVESINQGAFANCTALEAVTIPHRVHLIGYGAFQRMRATHPHHL